jgi:hypothetical protein
MKRIHKEMGQLRSKLKAREETEHLDVVVAPLRKELEKARKEALFLEGLNAKLKRENQNLREQCGVL